MKRVRRVAVLIFDQVETLDFAGPFEVFSVCGRPEDKRYFKVFTVAQKPGPITAREGLSLNPARLLTDCPAPDVLVVPGGLGARQEMKNPVLLNWIRSASRTSELILSVCTGALILARAGLLDGLAATTHHLSLDLLRQIAPKTEVRAGERLVDNGRIVTAAGVSAGLDASLHVVARLLDPDTARRTAAYIEYDWSGPARSGGGRPGPEK